MQRSKYDFFSLFFSQWKSVCALRIQFNKQTKVHTCDVTAVTLKERIIYNVRVHTIIPHFVVPSARIYITHWYTTSNLSKTLCFFSFSLIAPFTLSPVIFFYIRVIHCIMRLYTRYDPLLCCCYCRFVSFKSHIEIINNDLW